MVGKPAQLAVPIQKHQEKTFFGWKSAETAPKFSCLRFCFCNNKMFVEYFKIFMILKTCDCTYFKIDTSLNHKNLVLKLFNPGFLQSSQISKRQISIFQRSKLIKTSVRWTYFSTSLNLLQSDQNTALTLSF